MPRVGVFRGTFNPIHFGHLLIADEICEFIELDRVLFVPASVPPHKPAGELAPAADPLRHDRARGARAPRFEVSDVELRRRPVLHGGYPLQALSSRGDLCLVIGSETFLDLLTWKDPRAVAALARR